MHITSLTNSVNLKNGTVYIDSSFPIKLEILSSHLLSFYRCIGYALMVEISEDDIDYENHAPGY